MFSSLCNGYRLLIRIALDFVGVHCTFHSHRYCNYSLVLFLKKKTTWKNTKMNKKNSIFYIIRLIYIVFERYKYGRYLSEFCSFFFEHVCNLMTLYFHFCARKRKKRRKNTVIYLLYNSLLAILLGRRCSQWTSMCNDQIDRHVVGIDSHSQYHNNEHHM